MSLHVSFTKQSFLTEQSQLGVNYLQSNAMEGVDHRASHNSIKLLRPEQRIPDFQVCSKAGIVSLYQYCAYDRYLLIIFSANESFKMVDKILQKKSLTEQHYLNFLTSVCIINNALSPSCFSEGLTWADNVFIDTTNVHERFGIKKACFVLVRPDTFIAQVKELDDDESILSFLKTLHP